MPRITKDRIGERVGRLVVLKRMTGKVVSWLCRCDCGAKKVILGYNLRIGHTESCGCLWREVALTAMHEANITHGLSGNPTYSSWKSAIDRCYNPTNVRYKHYHGRGIVMCKRWRLHPELFIKDMEMRPEDLSLDRKDNDGNYSCGKCKQCKRKGWPMNCRWATRSQQVQNRRPVTEKARHNMSVAAFNRYARQ